MLVPAVVFMLVFWGSSMDFLMMLLGVELILYLASAIKCWSHVIMLMLILEFFSVSGFVCCSLAGTSAVGPLVVFLFSVVMVCEASMGMSLIVALTRGRGDEMIKV